MPNQNNVESAGSNYDSQEPLVLDKKLTVWQKWLYYNADMFMRHIGTAGVVYGGLSIKHHEANWSDLWSSLLTGAIVPTLFTIFSRGLPRIVESTVTTRTVETTESVVKTTTPVVEEKKPQ